MRAALLSLAGAALLVVGCAAAPVRPISPTALRGVTIALPTPTDQRRSATLGCGQESINLPLQAQKVLVRLFGEAGATPALSSRAPWALTVNIEQAGMGLEYSGAKQTQNVWTVDHTGENQIPPSGSEGGPFNGDFGDATVALEATLTHDGQLAWRGNVTGHARAPSCVDAPRKVHEALEQAVSELREKVIQQIRLAP